MALEMRALSMAGNLKAQAIRAGHSGWRCCTRGIPRGLRATDAHERRLIRKGYRVAWWVRHFSGRARDDHHAMEVDHVVPKSRGGCARLDNLQLMTRRDNQLKGNRLPE